MIRFLLALITVGLLGQTNVPPRQLRGCQVPAGAQGAVFISVSGSIGATCAVIGSGFTVSSVNGAVTLNPAASTSLMQTVGVTVDANTPNSFPLPPGATHLLAVFRNLIQLPCNATAPGICTPPANGDYTFINGIVVFTSPLQIGDTIIVEGW